MNWQPFHELGEWSFSFATGTETKDSLSGGTKDPFYSSTIPERVADNLALGWLEKATGDKFVRTPGGIITKKSSDKYRLEARREFLADLVSRSLTARKK